MPCTPSKPGLPDEVGIVQAAGHIHFILRTAVGRVLCLERLDCNVMPLRMTATPQCSGPGTSRQLQGAGCIRLSVGRSLANSTRKLAWTGYGACRDAQLAIVLCHQGLRQTVEAGGSPGAACALLVPLNTAHTLDPFMPVHSDAMPPHPTRPSVSQPAQDPIFNNDSPARWRQRRPRSRRLPGALGCPHLPAEWLRWGAGLQGPARRQGCCPETARPEPGHLPAPAAPACVARWCGLERGCMCGGCRLWKAAVPC